MQVILKVIYFTFVVSKESDEADCGCNEMAAVPKAAMPAASAPTWQPPTMEPAAVVKTVWSQGRSSGRRRRDSGTGTDETHDHSAVCDT